MAIAQVVVLALLVGSSIGDRFDGAGIACRRSSGSAIATRGRNETVGCCATDHTINKPLRRMIEVAVPETVAVKLVHCPAWESLRPDTLMPAMAAGPGGEPLPDVGYWAKSVGVTVDAEAKH